MGRIVCIGILLLGENGLWSFYRPYIRYTKHPRMVLKQLKVIDKSFANLPYRVWRGERIRIVLIGAHGLNQNGESTALLSDRISHRGLSEEFYSIRLSKALYQQFRQNPHFSILTHPDYRKHLEKEDPNYRYWRLKDILFFAEKHRAHLLIAEHLNNVAKELKVENEMRPGIHFTISREGKPYVVDIERPEKGFLTLYKPTDPLGISRGIAEYTKIEMLRDRYRPNGWGKGTVADSRFGYFYTPFPSIIFETAFLCTVEDEQIVWDRQSVSRIAQNHYRAIVRAFEDALGVELDADGQPKKRRDFQIKARQWKQRMIALKASIVAFNLIRDRKFYRARALLKKAQRLDKDAFHHLIKKINFIIKTKRIFNQQKNPLKRLRWGYRLLYRASGHLWFPFRKAIYKRLRAIRIPPRPPRPKRYLLILKHSDDLPKAVEETLGMADPSIVKSIGQWLDQTNVRKGLFLFRLDEQLRPYAIQKRKKVELNASHIIHHAILANSPLGWFRKAMPAFLTAKEN